MAKKKPARKTSKGKKKAAKGKKKAAPKKAAGKSKASAKRSSARGKAKDNVAVVEIAEIDVIAEPEETGHDDDEFPPDYGGSE